MYLFFVDFSFAYFCNTDITSDVLANGCGHLFTAAAIYVVLHALTKLTSHPCVAYCICRGATGC